MAREAASLDSGFRRKDVSTSEGYAAVAALGLVLAITALWWALALWPLPDETPDWVLRTRAICFGSTQSGLPDATGWMILIGEPLAMLGALLVAWRRAVMKGISQMARSAAGRTVIAGGALGVLAGLVAATARVVSAQTRSASWTEVAAVAPSTYPRLDRPAPALDGLVDQQGQPVSLVRFAGRPLLVTFAYAHCATICPLLVHDVLAAQRDLKGGTADALSVLVVTLDPWRDTPARLPAIAKTWKLDDDAYVASGPPQRVVDVLRRWNVAWSRDERTGEIVHPAVVYLVDQSGMLAYAATADTRLIVELAGRL